MRPWFLAAVVATLLLPPAVPMALGQETEPGQHLASCNTMNASINPSSANMTVGIPMFFTAHVVCDGQNVTSQSIIRWSVAASAVPIGNVTPEFGATTKFSPTAAGKGAVAANITYNMSGLQVAAPVNVVSGGTVSCHYFTARIEPQGATLKVQEKRRFIAEAWCEDQSGAKVNVTGQTRFNWSLQGASIGSLSVPQGPMTEFTASANGNASLELSADLQAQIAQDMVPISVGAANVCQSVRAYVDPTPSAVKVDRQLPLYGHAICATTDVSSGSTFAWRVVTGPGKLTTSNLNATGLTGTAQGTVVVELSVGFNSATNTTTLTIGVIPPDLYLDLTPKNANRFPGGLVQFAARVTTTQGGPAVNANLAWKVLGPTQVGSVDQNGLFTANAPGQAEVQVDARYLGSKVSAKATVTVSTVLPVSLTISPGQATLQVGENATFTAAAKGPAGQNLVVPISWNLQGSVGKLSASSGPTVTFSATSVGTAKIQALADGASGPLLATSDIEVLVIPAELMLITGIVRDADGVPVAGAEVSAIDITDVTVNSTSTDPMGEFAMFVPRGDYTLRIKHPSYGDESVRVEAGGNPKVEVNAILKQRPGTPPAGPGGIGLALGIGAGFVGLFVVILAVLSEAVFFALALIPILLYSRLRREKILDQFTRGQIFGYIMAYPGTTYRGIKRGLGLNNGTLTYHLYTLDREQFVRSRVDGVYKRFYPIDVRIPDDAGEEVTAFQRRLWKLVGEEPGISQAEAAERLGTKKQNVFYNAKRMQRAGMIRISKSNGRTMLYPGARTPSERERAASHAVSAAAQLATEDIMHSDGPAAVMGARQAGTRITEQTPVSTSPPRGETAPYPAPGAPPSSPAPRRASERPLSDDQQ